jgi:hypothetical protein
MTIESTAIALAWVAIAILAFAMAGVVRQIRTIALGHMPRPLAGPPLGAKAPPLHGVDASELDLLVFADIDCSACAEVLPHLAHRIRNLDGAWNAFVLYRGDANGHGEDDGPVVMRNQPDAFRDYAIPATPFAVAVEGGTIRDASPIGSVSTMEAFLLRNGWGGDNERNELR